MLTVTGGIFGMQFDALIIGFLAGLLALSFQEKTTYVRMLGAVFSSSLLAGCLSPILTALALHYLDFLSLVGAELLRIASAALIGLVTQTVIPIALRRLKSLIDNYAPGSTQ